MPRAALLATLCLLAAGPAPASPQSALAAASKDACTLSDDRACRTRYMARPPWVSRQDWAETWVPKLLKAWANGLSRESEFAGFRAVGPDVVAVILDDFKWDAKVWEKQRREPYFHRSRLEWYEAGAGYEAGWYRVYYRPHWLDANDLCKLEERTHSKVGIVRADWWLFYSSRQIDLDNKERGFGYLDWLGLKKRADFEALREVDKKRSIRIGLELRAVIEEDHSGVAQKGRQIEWFATYGDGDYWLTLDTDDTSNDNRPPARLEPGAFLHKAEEGYISLPNDLWAYWLGNDKGVKQATAPDFIGPNDSPLRKELGGRDARIHFASCLHCHVEGGLQPIDDWARRTFRGGRQLDEEDYQKALRFKRQYTSDLNARLEKGRARYAAALKNCADLDPAGFARLHAVAYYGYAPRPRTAADLAAEMGVTEACLLKALRAAFDPKNKRLGAADRRRLADLLSLIDDKDPRPIPVKTVEDLFGDLEDLVRDYP